MSIFLGGICFSEQSLGMSTRLARMCPSITLLIYPVSLIAGAQTYSSLLMLVLASLLPTLFYKFTNWMTTSGVTNPEGSSSYIPEISHCVRTYHIFSISSLLMGADPGRDDPAFR